MAKDKQFEMPEEEEMNEEGQALTLDQLDSLGFNDERDQEELNKLFPPAGNWNKEDTFQFRIVNYDNDIQVGDLSDKGRTIYSFSGKPEPRELNGVEYQPVLFFRMSPDIRYKEDDPTKIDHTYRMFLRAKELFLSIKEYKPKTQRELVEMLVEDRYVIRTMNGDSGPFVLDILPKRNKK